MTAHRKWRRAKFSGCIVGSVVVRAGETDEDAVARAQAVLLSLMDRRAMALGQCPEGPGKPDHGPNVGLALEEH